MRDPRSAQDALDAALDQLERERVVELRLENLEELGREPDLAPFALHQGPRRSGIDDVVLTLCAARRLPEELTLRLTLPPGGARDVLPADVQAWLHDVALDAASVSWREAMAVRSMGVRQLPIGIAVAFVAAVVAYAAGYAGAGFDGVVGKGFLFVLAGIAITVAWVASWMVVESTVFDWRQLGRKASAYELLGAATVDVVELS